MHNMRTIYKEHAPYMKIICRKHVKKVENMHEKCKKKCISYAKNAEMCKTTQKYAKKYANICKSMQKIRTNAE